MGQHVALNEFMSSNTSAIADEDGDFSDWIELYNSGSTAVQLENFGLSDDHNLPFKWTFPNNLLPPNSFLLVFASDKDRKTGPYLHTNFKISAAGESLRLVNAGGIPVDSLPAIALTANVSYGRQPDGSTNLVFFTNPTPGSSNPGSGNSGVLSSPVFSQVGGFYTNPIMVSLSTTSVGAVIRYTLDGSEPTENSPAYTVPLSIQSKTGTPNDLSLIPTNQVKTGPSTFIPPPQEVFKATVIRARAFLPNSPPSDVVTHTYFVDPQINQRYSLPVISIATDKDGFFGSKNGIYVAGEDFNGDNDRSGNYFQRGDAWERVANLEFFDTDRTKGFSQRVDLRIHGSATRVEPQKTLRIYANEKYGKPTIQYPIFPDKPIKEFKHLLLRNSGNDRSYTMLRDGFQQSLVRDLNLDTQGYRPAVVFINGEYWGIHNIQERRDNDYLAENHAVNPDSLDFLEMDRQVLNGDATHYQQLLDFIQQHDIRIKANLDTVARRMDLDEFMNYQASEIFMANVDWPGNNLQYWRPRTTQGHWRWLFYDLDFGFGLADNSKANRNMLTYAVDPNGPTFPTPTAANCPYGTFLFRNLLENNLFKYHFINRFADLLNSTFKTERVIQKLDTMQAVIAPAMAEHIARWSAPASISEWNNNVEAIRTFARQRPDYQRQHLIDYFNLGGTAAVMLNVSDPAKGSIRINTLSINENTPGVGSTPYPWKGIYFKNVPITLTALPKPGFRFVSWSDASLPQQASVQVILQQDISLTALFVDEEANPPLAMPTLFNLSQGNYSFAEWEANNPATTYPNNLVFQRTADQDPALSSEITGVYNSPYNLTSGTRINGLGTEGFSFINTGTDGNLGAAVLGLNSTSRTNITVNWKGSTIRPNSRIYAIRLQYRAESGGWTDVPGTIEYVRNPVAGHQQQFSSNLSVATSNAVDNQSVLYLRWKYYFVSGNSGPRAELSVSNIVVTSIAPLAAPTQLAVASVNGNRPPSSNAPFSLAVEAQNGDGNAQPVSANTDVVITRTTGSGTMSGTLTGTILAGQSSATIENVTYDRADTGVVLTATRSAGDALQPGSGTPFTVLGKASVMAFVDNYPYGSAGTPYRPFSVAAKRADNSLDANFGGNVTVSVASGGNYLSGTFTRPFVGGVANFNDLVFTQGGIYTLTATSTDLNPATTSSIKVVGLTEVIVPKFVQGQNGSNTNRIPFAFRVTLNNLNSNAKYRYFNQVVLPIDGITVNGSGNVIFAESQGFRRTSDVSVNKTGQYSEFTTDANGSYTGWFITEPTGNERFAPGNQMNMRIMLSDGGGGSDVFFRLTTSSLVTVVNFGSDAASGTGMVGNSCAGARDLVVLYDKTDGSDRPITATVVEDDGAGNSLANSYAPFYVNQVEGKAGSWGAIIPNNLPNGIRRIEQRSLANGSVLHFNTSADGRWGNVITVSPNGGNVPLMIPGLAAPLANAPGITQDGVELMSSLSTGNQWYLNETAIMGATGQRYKPSQSGIYKVLDSTCPYNFSQPFNFILTEVPSQWNSQLAWQVYPNPTNGQVRMLFKNGQITRIEVRLLNLLGQEVNRLYLESATGEYDQLLDLSAEQNGLYLLQIRYGDHAMTRKVVLQR